ncbi:MAG TPA: sigma-70 family RNA polymerase sigma factor [Polyangiaceae bacterium]|nr:sigma-70 family RNA polymerase sigma factor [Polyangiaceae bacterium]
MSTSSSSRAQRLRLVGSTTSGAVQRRFGATGELDDAKLVALACNNDTLAFEVLYRRHAAFALNLAVRIQGSASDAEDIVHDAFLRAHHRMRELRDASLFRSWLGAIVVRQVRSRLRRKRLLNAFGIGTVDPVDLDAVASLEADPETRAQLAQIYALLQTMPADERIAWTLRNIERHRLEAVAELSECSLATAKRRIQRAQRFLHDHFVAPFAAESS